MDVRPIEESDLRTLAELAVALQARPESHVIHLSLDVDAIATELSETTWRDVSAVARVDGAPVGWLVGDVDPEMGRVWWYGPFVAGEPWEEIALALLVACRDRLPPAVAEEEIAVDARFTRCRTWATRLGFVEEEGSSVLVLEGMIDPPSATVREIVAADHDRLAALHDRLFPGTHTTGAGLIASHDATHRRLVVDVDGELAGYAAVDLFADGKGYIDYLGVDPRLRRRGLGLDLVRGGVAELRRLGAGEIALTVRETNLAARRLYADLGFVEERIAVPIRLGFSLA